MTSKIKVMLVDDSAVVRGLMQRALINDPKIEIVATASDGQMALDVLQRNSIDIIILDIEMAGMDGITALPQLIKASPSTRVIMASSLTLRNAEVSLRALNLGASDCIAKPGAKDLGEVEEFYRQLITKIHGLATKSATTATAAPPAELVYKPPIRAGALAIASSTGGPRALVDIFREFKGLKPRIPIFITQHMPPNFTTILAQHITTSCGLDCHEAVAGEVVVPGVIYLAPGDFHMTVERTGAALKMQIDKNPQENFCRPSADPMLRSLAKIYGNTLLTVVLTGLGSDGAKGAAEVVAAGGSVVAQDEASCVVYGMPKAVADAKLASAILPLAQIPSYLVKASV